MAQQASGPGPIAPPDLLCLCLSSLACCAIDAAGLFQPLDGDQEGTEQSQLMALTAKVAAQQQPTPHEVARLLVIWLRHQPPLLPPCTQQSLLQLLSSSKLQEQQVAALRQCLSEVDAASAASVKPLVLFLGQYLLCQQHFDDELNQVCRVFAPLLFSAAGPEAAGQAEQATALLLSRAIEVLCPADVWAATACTAQAAPRPGTACRRLLTDDREVVQEGQLHPEGGHHPEAEAGEGREAGNMESDPLLAEALERLVSLAVGSALFGAGEAGSEAGDSRCPSCRATPRGEEESLRAVLYEEHGREEGVFCVVMALDTPRTKASKVAAAAAAVLGQRSPRHCLHMEAASLCL